MAGPVRADLLVGRVDGVAAGVADAGRYNALDLAERGLDAPEASRGKRRALQAIVVHQLSFPFSVHADRDPARGENGSDELGVERDLGDAGERARDRASRLGLLGVGGELLLIDARNAALRHEVDLSDRRRIVDEPQVALGGRLHRFRWMSVAGEDVAERHREAPGVGRADQLLRIGPWTLLEP